MFQPGELLVYGSTGVCQVLSIDQRQDYVNGVKQSRLYYQLKPLYQGGVIYTPVDNDKVVMRPVISREDAETLIDSIPTLRPAVERPESNDLTAWITALAHARTQSKALCCGSYRNVLVQPKQLIFERYADGERVLVAINADGNPFTAHFDAGCGMAVDMITGAPHDFGGGSELAPYSVSYWKMER